MYFFLYSEVFVILSISADQCISLIISVYHPGMKTVNINLSHLDLASRLKSSSMATSFSLDTLAQYYKIAEDTSVDVYPNHRCLSFSWMLSDASTLARMHISKVMLVANHNEKRTGRVKRLTYMQDVHPKPEAWSQHLGWQLTAAIRDEKATVRIEVFHTCYMDYKHSIRRSGLWASYEGHITKSVLAQ